jgi:hypothetical protein
VIEVSCTFQYHHCTARKCCNNVPYDLYFHFAVCKEETG